MTYVEYPRTASMPASLKRRLVSLAEAGVLASKAVVWGPMTGLLGLAAVLFCPASSGSLLALVATVVGPVFAIVGHFKCIFLTVDAVEQLTARRPRSQWLSFPAALATCLLPVVGGLVAVGVAVWSWAELRRHGIRSGKAWLKELGHQGEAGAI